MDNEKLVGSAECTTLSRRVALVEACQRLAQSIDHRQIDQQDRKKLYQLVFANDIIPPDVMKMKVLAASALDLDVCGTGQTKFLKLLNPNFGAHFGFVVALSH